MHFNRDKFKELILYISEKLGGECGAVKLNKVLFFSDFYAYAHFGQSITGEEYVHWDRGPLPHHLTSVREELEASGDIRIEKIQKFKFVQHRITPMRPAKKETFGVTELSLVDDVINGLLGRTAIEVSELSHELSIGWQLTQNKETIPYSSVFLTKDPLTDDEVALVASSWREHLSTMVA